MLPDIVRFVGAGSWLAVGAGWEIVRVNLSHTHKFPVLNSIHESKLPAVVALSPTMVNVAVPF